VAIEGFKAAAWSVRFLIFFYSFLQHMFHDFGELIKLAHVKVYVKFEDVLVYMEFN